jgi:hypothetical protein
VCPILGCRRSLPVGVHDVDADTPTTDTCYQSAQSSRSATPSADYLAEVLGVDVHLDRSSTPVGQQVDLDLIGIVDDPANQMLDGVDYH